MPDGLIAGDAGTGKLMYVPSAALWSSSSESLASADASTYATSRSGKQIEGSRMQIHPGSTEHEALHQVAEAEQPDHRDRQRGERTHRIDDHALAVFRDHPRDFGERIEDAGAGLAVHQRHVGDGRILGETPVDVSGAAD